MIINRRLDKAAVLKKTVALHFAPTSSISDIKTETTNDNNNSSGTMDTSDGHTIANGHTTTAATTDVKAS